MADPFASVRKQVKTGTSATSKTPSGPDPFAKLRTQIADKSLNTGSLKSGTARPATTASDTPTAEQLRTGRYPSEQSKLQKLQLLPLLDRIERLEKLVPGP
jgi:hypothetical protein